MGAKTSQELLAALELVRSGMTPYAAVRVLAERGLHISEQAVFQSRQYKIWKELNSQSAENKT